MNTLALSQDYFRMQQDYFEKIIVTSQHRKYINKRTTELAAEGWKVQSMQVDSEGYIRATMVKKEKV